MTKSTSLGVEAIFYKDWFCSVTSKWEWSDLVHLEGPCQSAQKFKFAHYLFFKFAHPPSSPKKGKRKPTGVEPFSLEAKQALSTLAREEVVPLNMTLAKMGQEAASVVLLSPRHVLAQGHHVNPHAKGRHRHR